jgi:hypothetical protein
MKNQSFSTDFTVEKKPAEVFAAITNVRGWWSQGIEGAAGELGDEFTYHHADLHRSTQRLIEVVPHERIVWLVAEAHLSFVVGDTHEWKGTRIVFDIAGRGNETELRVTHEGLDPSCECFEACSRGWGFYIHNSLKTLITTGRGRPDPQVR